MKKLVDVRKELFNASVEYLKGLTIEERANVLKELQAEKETRRVETWNTRLDSHIEYVLFECSFLFK